MCLLNWIWDVATCTQSHIIKVGGQSWGRTCYPPAHLFETLTSRGIACGSSLSHRAFDCIFCVSRLCHQLVKLAMLELVFRKRLSSSFFLDSSQLEQSQKDFVEHGDTDDLPIKIISTGPPQYLQQCRTSFQNPSSCALLSGSKSACDIVLGLVLPSSDASDHLVNEPIWRSKTQ